MCSMKCLEDSCEAFHFDEARATCELGSVVNTTLDAGGIPFFFLNRKQGGGGIPLHKPTHVKKPGRVVPSAEMTALRDFLGGTGSPI